MTYIALRKTPYGLQPADKPTDKVIREAEQGSVIRAKVVEDQRSISQNRIYWKWLSVIGQERGLTKDDLHEVIKKHYVLPVLVRDDEEYAAILDKVQGLGAEAFDTFVRRFISTTDLSVKQFAEVLDEIDVDAAQRGIRLPRKDDGYYEALMKEAA